MDVINSTLHLWMLQCHWHSQPCIYGCSSITDTANLASMDAPVSMTLSILQLWMLQCHWHNQPCSYGCFSVIDTINLAAMDAPVSLTQSTLQLWMLQCHWHNQPCSYGCFSVIDTTNLAAMDAPVSLTQSTLQLWMLQCHWHNQPCSYGCFSVIDTINLAAMDAPVSMTKSTLQLWMFQCQWHYQPCSNGCSSVTDTGATIAVRLTKFIHIYIWTVLNNSWKILNSQPIQSVASGTNGGLVCYNSLYCCTTINSAHAELFALPLQRDGTVVNSLDAAFFLDTQMTQVVEISHHGRQGPVYCTQLIL